MKNEKILKLTETAILIAIILIMTFTPLGYLPIGLLQISLLTIPVAIGASVVGWQSATILGLAFGLSSFSTCFGRDPFGGLLLSINPVGTFITCIVARVLTGLCCGLLFLALSKIDKHGVVATVAASAGAAIFNAIFFLGCLLIFFGSNEEVAAYIGKTVLAFVLATIATNTIWEVLACAIIGTAISLALRKALKRTA